MTSPAIISLIAFVNILLKNMELLSLLFSESEVGDIIIILNCKSDFPCYNSFDCICQYNFKNKSGVTAPMWSESAVWT